MEALLTVVLSALGAVSAGALDGATGEMGRRSSEALLGLVRRAHRGDEGGDDGQEGREGEPELPVTEAERRALAERLVRYARSSPDRAREVADWAREAELLGPRAIPAVVHGTHAVSRPRMLLPATASFTDRADVAGRIAQAAAGEDRADGAPAVVLLTGPGGIGKSATAAHTAHLLKERFPDGQLYADLAGASEATALAPSEVLVRFLDRLGVPPGRMPAGQERQAELYRDCTAGRRLLVVLDDAASAPQVGPLLPASAHCLVIVTSRRRLDPLVAHFGARHIPLGPLSDDDSVRLLTRIAGGAQEEGEEPREELGAVARVAARCAGIPLALCTTGARVAVRRHLTWEAVERQLSEAASPDPGVPVPVPVPGTPVESVHDEAYAELSDDCARLYRLAGVWAWPAVTVPMAAKAADVGEARARALLEELADVHLIEEVAEERYRFHDVVRAHARRKAEAVDGQRAIAAAIRRTVAVQLRSAAAADVRVIPGRWRLGPAYTGLTAAGSRDPEDGRAALAELRRERENLAAAVRAAEQYGCDALAWQLCEAMWGLHLRLGFHEQWTDTHRRGVAAARRCAKDEFGDPRAVARVLVQLAFAHMGVGRVSEAETALTEAAEVDGAAGHHRGRASAVEALGLLRLKQWRHRDAEACFREARRTLERIRPGDDGERDVPRARALLAHHIGRALRGQERYEDAVRLLHEALAQFRALESGGDRYNEGRVYMSLGETHLDAGDPELARVCLDEAISTMGREGAELQHADAAELRARCARRLGRRAEEAADLRVAEELYGRAGDGVSAARVRGRLAELGAS
ncbi:ATP-binding protein [Streptomyces sp. PR69]|uniref:ATP-binding protein n=1 Tax=Streptomyces sp. PR69 TaxID=2984950 RepID=UPI002265387E|nr:tetratricopeptide repeat protein [Streptomyces sp. PR69]